MRTYLPKHPKPTPLAFTLIELLVVVSIIALLVAILLPSLTKARKISQLTVCQSNIRGFYMGYALYAEEFNGTMLTGMDGGQPLRTNWIWRSNGAATSESNATIRSQGFAIYRYKTASVKMAYCPASTSTWTYEKQKAIVDPPNWTQHGRSGYSLYVAPDWGNNSGAGSFSIYPSAVVGGISWANAYPGLNPSRKAYHIEDLSGRIDGKKKAIMTDYISGSGAISTTHENKLNVLYADGAIQALPNDAAMKSVLALSISGATPAGWENAFTQWNFFTSQY